jgi:ABC-type transport system involved in cytochrome bd biosynthesis fused ATPase/permease subunit
MPLDITDNKIRARQHEPSEYEKGSFRTIRLTGGIKAIVGRKKGEKSTSIQSILFDKKKFTEEQANSWLQRHNEKFADAMALEEQKMSLFSTDLADHMIGHLPPLSEKQIERLLELAGPAEDDVEDSEDSTPEVEPMSRFVKKI